MLSWILGFLGVAVVFLGLFINRANKSTPNFKFWLGDNWVELLQSVLFIIGILIILDLTKFNNESFQLWLNAIIEKRLSFEMPSDFILPAKETISFAIGLFCPAIL